MKKMISENLQEVTADTKMIEINNGYCRISYLRNEQLEIHLFNNQIYITEIENAQKTGKYCKVYGYNIDGFEHNTKVALCHISNTYGNTVIDLVNALKNENIEGISKFEREKKGINTFSPFIEQKAIKEPKQWRKSHIIKAIYSGQITSVTGSGRYTDDYAYDAAVNFGIGNEYNLMDYVRELIEDNSKGYTFHECGRDGEEIELSISLYTFDYKKAVFIADAKKEEPKEEIEPVNEEYTIEESKHTKTNATLWLVKFTKTLDKAEYIALNKRIKELGGYYSRFTHSFIFNTDPTEILKSA